MGGSRLPKNFRDRRIEKHDPCDSDETTRYYYDGWRVLSEHDGADDNQAMLRYFVYGNYIDEVLMMRYKMGRQFVVFGCVGLSGMVVGLGTLNICMLVLPCFPAANAVSFVMAVSWNFTLNRRCTFDPTNKPILRQWCEYVLACLGGALLNWSVSLGLYYSIAFFGRHHRHRRGNYG